MDELFASRSVRARALACCAYFFFRNRNSWGPLDADKLYRAGFYADQCLALGFNPPIIVLIASNIENLGFRRQSDNRFTPGIDVSRFVALENLWEALDENKAAVANLNRRREQKVNKRPNAYYCATPGCGIEATKKSALMRCSGPCSADEKPSYCSKECQRKVSPVSNRSGDGMLKSIRIGRSTRKCASRRARRLQMPRRRMLISKTVPNRTTPSPRDLLGSRNARRPMARSA